MRGFEPTADKQRRYVSAVRNTPYPVQIVWGADDPGIPLARGQALHAMIPRAGFEVLAGVGHLPQLEAPDRVVQVIG